MPPPGRRKDKEDKAAEQSFANFMTSTAGGTQGSSNYGGQQNRPPVFGSTPETGGGGSSGDYNPNLNVPPNIGGGDGGSGDGGSGDGGSGDGATTKTDKTPIEFVSDLFIGKPLNQLDRLELEFAQRMLSNYQKLDEKNPLKLFALMQRDRANMIGSLLGKDIDGTYSDESGDFVDSDKVKNLNIGGIETLVDEDGNPVRRTRGGTNEMLEDLLGENIEERLKKFAPDILYGSDFATMPATSGGLANLADNPALQKNSDGTYSTPDGRTISKEQGAKYNNMIFDARMQLDRMGRDMFGNKNDDSFKTSGGGGGTYVPPTTTPDDPIIPQDPTLPPGVTPPTTTPKFPGSVITDYTQLGLPNIYGNQQMPNYGNFYQGQGGQPIGLQNYLDNLRKRFGIG